MSEDLGDEVEALNSIYGEGCLTPAEDQNETSASPSTYILQLPGDESSSLRLQFPASYPAEPPAVLGTQHSSGGRKGAGARDLGVFREALGTVFQPGSVCLFDAVEEFSRRIEEEREREELLQQQQHEAEDADDVEGEGRNAERGERTVDGGQVDFSAMAPPPWTLSEVVVENKSTFVAHVARVTSPAEAKLFLQHLLWSDKRIRSATHNITAWRMRGEGAASYQDCDDDGEDAAGGRLLHLLQLMEVWDCMVVVTRWYGGVKLGPRRFALINSVARDGLVRAGMGDGGKEKEKKKGK
ncbi:impact family [Trichoderma arundinaceum]|uniref:Impact family n=1 Tax=Trichoderma arundinaceum TaxID=490622 RepID=A0A395NML1_TRIAR|nr:impact family [Trichoderma arundinaceum]